MPVERTYCENNKTIRIWSESRVRNNGKRYQLKRKFYLHYEIVAIINGKIEVKTYDNIDQAEYEMKNWMDEIAESRGIERSKWFRNDRAFCSYNEEVGYWVLSGRGIIAECYVIERGGELIEEFEV